MYSVVVYAKDMGRVALFYKATLALLELEEGPTFMVLGDVDLEVNIVQIPPELSIGIAISHPPMLRQDTPIKPSFLVENLEDIAAQAVATGGRVKPLNEAWAWRGQLHLDGSDPEGNVVQFRASEA
jgi:predicted enzyme related to lactoylglutathione lyase